MKTIPLLHYEIAGNGPTVLLLHGYMSNNHYWDSVKVELAKRHRVIAFDLLGFGKSPKPGCSKYDLDAQQRSINATLNKLDVTGPFTLVGHSMGSLIALRYATLNPMRIKKLLLTNMPIFNNRTEARKDIYSTQPLYRFALKPGFHAIIWPVFKTVLLLRLLPARITGNLTTHRRYMFQNNRFARIRSMRNLIFQAKVEADLKALQVKTVVLSGINDRAVYLRNLSRFTLGNRIQSLVVEGGHHLPQTSPQLVAELV
jgi:pimeloyl-ACP methyl ester carboxylesterase